MYMYFCVALCFCCVVLCCLTLSSVDDYSTVYLGDSTCIYMYMFPHINTCRCISYDTPLLHRNMYIIESVGSICRDGADTPIKS